MFFKIGALENLTSLTGKHLRFSLFLIKLQALEICEIFKNSFFQQSTSGGWFWKSKSVMFLKLEAKE